MSQLPPHVERVASQIADSDTAELLPEEIAALTAAIRKGNLDRVRELIEEKPTLLRADTGSGATALHRAAEFNHPAIIDLLLATGADISAKLGRYAHTPLSWALMSRSFEAAQRLVESGAKADLFCAAGMGDVETVRSFFGSYGSLRSGASETGSSRYGINGELLPFPLTDDREIISDALYSASRNGHSNVVAELLAHHPMLDFRAYLGGTPLHWAYFSASVEAVDLLLSAGADPNLLDDVFKCTPRAFGICIASNWGMKFLVQLQLARDPDLVNIAGGRGTPLHEAARGGSAAVVKLLLDHHADRHALDPDGLIAADIARVEKHAAVLELLEAVGDASNTSDLLNQFLDAAVPKPDGDHSSGSLRPARDLLATTPTLVGQSFFAACVVGDVEIVRRFLSQDAMLARLTGGPRGWPALCYLTFSRFLREEKQRADDFVKCAKLLLDAGADPNSSWPAPNDPALREAALYGAAGIANCAPLTQLLIDAGADVNDHESLYHASEFADNASLRVLLDAKPDAKSVNYNLCHKMDMEDPAGVKLFIEHGADVNVVLKRGMFKGSRPLHFAIYRRRSLKIFRILLRAGADPMLADSKGVTPYQLASRMGLNAIARLLGADAAEDLDAFSQYFSALSSGYRKKAETLLRHDPELKSRVTPRDHHLLVDAAESANIRAVALMLDHGFPITTRGATYGGWDASALDQAAWLGHEKIVRLLLKRGADPTTKHGFGGDALGAAIHGSSHASHTRGTGAVEALAEVASDTRLEKAIEYAKTEPNQEVVAALERVRAKRMLF